MKRIEPGLAWLTGSPPGVNSCSAILGLGLGLALGNRAFATDAAAATADSWLGRSAHEYAAEANLECPEETTLEMLKSVHGDTRILDRECPEGSLPFGSAPPHGRQIWCVDLSGRPAAEQSLPLPSATWYDETADPVLDRPDVFGSRTAMRGCGPLRIESADALGPPERGVGR